jgi:predicted extracellular nuclease
LIPAGGYLVLGNNTDFATNGGVDVAYSYGSGWYLSNGADEVVLLDVLITEIDRVEYDGGAVFPDPTGASMALLNPALDNNVGANWCTASTSYGAGDLGTPGAANDCPAPECNDPFTPVFEIQGDGFTAAITGPITTQGVVIGDFEGLYPALRGFYIQDINGDGDPATSDGLFIFNGNNDSVEVGQIVRVDGSAGEYYEQTQISSVTSIAQCGTASVDPTPISLPIPSTDYLERFEGMIVTFPQTLYISEYFNFDRYGEIVLTPQRQLQPTAIYEPGSPQADAMAQENLLSRITLDDGRTNQNPDPAVHPNGGIFDLTNRFRGGDKLDAVTGVMDYRYDLYRIQPTQGAMYTPMNPRTGQPADVGGDLKVANFNVLNYFTTLNSRGANTPEEFVRQRDKIFAALEAIDADIVGLIEIENNGTAVQDLVQGLNAWIGSPIYSYVDTGLIGDDAITVAFIYKPSVVELVGDFEALVDSTFTDPLNYGEQKNRPALAQTFHSIQDDATFTVVVNHFKSKGSECGPGDDDLVQGSCNLTRMLAAQALVDWLATDPTGSLDPDFLVIGDLNAYDKEDPIDVLVGAGYTDIVRQFEGENAYTYVYDGQLGYLDHALSNPNLTPRITGVDTWHINADEPDILDYDMSYKQDAQDALYESNAYRSSDHDPVIVGLVPNEAPVCEAAYASVDLLWPVNHKFVSIEILGVIDGDGHELTITIDSIFQDEQVDENGDGSTAPDAIIGDDGTFELRAERVGDGNGRVYHIFFTADDGYGGSCLGEVLVSVPHDSGKKAEPPVDDGALFDSTVEPDPEAIEEAGVEPTPEPMPAPTEEPDVALTPEPTEAPDDKDKKDK